MKAVETGILWRGGRAVSVLTKSGRDALRIDLSGLAADDCRRWCDLARDEIGLRCGLPRDDRSILV